MVSKTFKVGIIGYGLSAKVFHIPFVNAVADFEFYAIVQRNPQPDNDASKDWPNIKSYKSTQEMVKDDELDVVIVTTTPETHLELATLALKAKKHVVVEKPFTPTSTEAQQLVDLAKEQGVLLTVYQNRRFDADFLTLRKYIDNGSLGRIAEYESHFDRHRPEVPATKTWKTTQRPGVSVVYDLGSHLMDQAVTLFGTPQKITAFVGNQRENDTSGVADACTILLHYPNGLLATIKAGVVSPEASQLRFWVRGVKGSFRKCFLDIQEDQLKEGKRPGDEGYGIEPSDRYATLNTVVDGKIKSEVVPTLEPASYVKYYERLASALKGDISQIPVDPKQAVDLIRLIELAHASSEQGKTLEV